MTSHSLTETIAALASAAGGGGRGIVRITGPTAIACAARMFASFETGPGANNRTTVERRRLNLNGLVIPCDVFVWPGERSYTRQPTVELHVPGAPPIVAATLEAALRHGARPAAPGEFTLRAFLAGRLDLTQAEAVLGVVDAVDRRRLDTALKQMAGGLTTPLRQLRSDLLDLTAHLEAGLDFVEEDIEFIARDELMRQLNVARESVAAVVAQATARGEGVERPRIALHGLPNVGKSSLFNALAQHDRALVSPTAGTTRDYLTAVVSLNGVECELIDTAGVEPITATQPSIDSAAQEQAMTQSGEADLLLICLDGSRPPTDWERQRAAEVDGRSIIVRTKADVTKSGEVADGSLRVSVVTGEGLDELRTALADAVRATRLNADEMVPATAVRCRDSLHRAAAALSAAAHVAQSRGGDELVAVELRTALDELGRVVGAVYTDDILDRIFSRFCIGK